MYPRKYLLFFYYNLPHYHTDRMGNILNNMSIEYYMFECELSIHWTKEGGVLV